MSYFRQVLLTSVTALAALLALAMPATAQTPSDRELTKLFESLLEAKTYNSIGETPGARVLTKGGRRVLALGPEMESTYRRLRGRRVILWCNQVFLSDEKRPSSLTSGGNHYRLPRRRVDFRPILDRGADVCTLAIRRAPSKSGAMQPVVSLSTAIASVAATEKGRVALDRWGPALRLSIVAELLEEEPDDGGGVVPMSFVDRFKPLVPLAGPGADPPPDGRVGVWTDGKQHRYVAVRTPMGHLFSSERNGEMISENTKYWLSSFDDFG